MTKTILFRRNDRSHLRQKVKLKKIHISKYRNNQVMIKLLETIGLQRLIQWNNRVSWDHTMKVTIPCYPKLQNGHQN